MIRKRATWSNFYKYGKITNPDWLKSIIIDHEYYFPTSSELNDPAECKTTIFDHSKEEMESFLIAQYLNDYPNTSELGIEKIEVYSEDGVYSKLPFIAVWKSGNILVRVSALFVTIKYREVKDA